MGCTDGVSIHDVASTKTDTTHTSVRYIPMEALDSAKRYEHWVPLYNADRRTSKLISITSVSSWVRSAFGDYFRFQAVDQLGFVVKGMMITANGRGQTYQSSVVDEWGTDIPIRMT